MDTTYILWFNNPIFDKISTNPKFLKEYKPAFDYSPDYAVWYLNETYGMATRAYCFSFESESKYNLFLLKFS